MEKLTVRNFVNLKEIDFEISKINIIIGNQATGKSLIAKLVYFFKSFLLDYKKSILKNKTKSQFERDIIERFELLFPRYAWEKQEFKIDYYFYGYQISIDNKLISNKKSKISLNYSEKLKDVFNKLKKSYGKKRELDTPSSVDLEELDFKDLFKEFVSFSSRFENYLYSSLFEPEDLRQFDELTFIPAGRSFFANLQKTVFSFLSNNMPIDYFLKEFGSTYEKVKGMYRFRANLFKQKLKKQDFSDIDALIRQIIIGDYSYQDGQDWIYLGKDNKTNLANASSGQQESLPMAIILTTLPFVTDASQMFVIEEPEAHLFPTSQKNIVNLISLIFNLTNKRHKFIVTTHSPYVLTAFNNLIQANNSLKEINSHKDRLVVKTLNSLYKLVPKNLILDIIDVRAYTLQDGKLNSILNEESNLIHTNIIDDVSNEFNFVFEKLLELEYE